MSNWVHTVESEGLAALAEYLDRLDDAARIAETRGVSGRDQVLLWDLASSCPATLADFVPPGVDAGRPVVHAGKNSLPVFREFEKHFCRSTANPDVIYGFNEGATRPVVGPGYFEVHEFGDRPEVGIDYTRVPVDFADRPSAWPRVRPNESGLSRFVYAGMIDFMRRISDHVTIGRATRGGKDTPNYFLLCRTGA